MFILMCSMILLINTITQFIEQLIKPVDVKDNTYVDSQKETNDKDIEFKVGDHVRIPKYKNTFAKGYMSNWPEEVFIVSKIKNAVPWTPVINDLNGDETTRTFYKEELQKTNQKELSNGSFMIIHLIFGLIKKI